MENNISNEEFEDLLKNAAYEVEFSDLLKDLREETAKLNQNPDSQARIQKEIHRFQRIRTIKILSAISSVAAVIVLGLFVARITYCDYLAYKYTNGIYIDENTSIGTNNIDSVSSDFIFAQYCKALKNKSSDFLQKYSNIIQNISKNDEQYYPTQYCQALNMLIKHNIKPAIKILEEVASTPNDYQDDAKAILSDLDKWWLF